MNRLRQAVSLEKRRFQQQSFDLDLSYVTPRVIAMGFPSTGMEKTYRNPASECRRFLETRHQDHYLVINLCGESVRQYDPVLFEGRVILFPFEDHNPPPMQVMFDCCRKMQEYLEQDPENVVVVHCKAGKGRTGVIVSCWLLYSGIWEEASDALDFFGAMRTNDKKGVTIMSQRRYVFYFAEMMRRIWKREKSQRRSLELLSVTPSSSENLAKSASSGKLSLSARTSGAPPLPVKDVSLHGPLLGTRGRLATLLNIVDDAPPQETAANGSEDDTSGSAAADENVKQINVMDIHVEEADDSDSEDEVRVASNPVPTGKAAQRILRRSTDLSSEGDPLMSPRTAAREVLDRISEGVQARARSKRHTNINHRKRSSLFRSLYVPPTLLLKRITLSPAPNVNLKDVRFLIAVSGCPLLTWEPDNIPSTPIDVAYCDCESLRVRGDIKVSFYKKETQNKLFHFWFNTMMVTERTVILHRHELDDAHKDKAAKVFDKTFKVELTFDMNGYIPPSDAPSHPSMEKPSMLRQLYSLPEVPETKAAAPQASTMLTMKSVPILFETASKEAPARQGYLSILSLDEVTRAMDKQQYYSVLQSKGSDGRHARLLFGSLSRSQDVWKFKEKSFIDLQGATVTAGDERANQMEIRSAVSGIDSGSLAVVLLAAADRFDCKDWLEAIEGADVIRKRPINEESAPLRKSYSSVTDLMSTSGPNVEHSLIKSKALLSKKKEPCDNCQTEKVAARVHVNGKSVMLCKTCVEEAVQQWTDK